MKASSFSLIKRFLVGTLVWGLVAGNSFGNESVKQLSQAFDSFLYKTQVEWDQKDKKVYKSLTNELAQSIHNSGATRAEIIEFAKSKITSEATRKQFESALAAVDLNIISSQDFAELVKTSLSQTGSSGANYSSGLAYAALGILLVAAVALAVVAGPAVCPGGYYTECYDYWDEYWGWWDTACYDYCY